VSEPLDGAVRRPPPLAGLLFVLGAALAAHLAFSWMGFNTTDEGFVLAYARRLLAGQVPHRDFVAIRPVLSPLLHAPEVALGGAYTLWLSRLVAWLEHAAIAWLWTRLLVESLGVRLRTWQLSTLAWVSLAASVHTFPIMAWHTVDGMLLAAVGIALFWGNARRDRSLVGYLLLGMAPLCKQNFAALVPVALLLAGDGRRWRCWLAAATPGAAYGAMLLATGALHDARTQLAAQSDLWTHGVARYVGSPHAGWWAALALAAMALREPWPGRGRARSASIAGTALLVVGVVHVLLGMRGIYWAFGDDAALAAFGMVLGIVAYRLTRDGPTTAARAGLLTLALAWAVSISVGVNDPQLAAGPLVVYVLLTVATTAVPRAARLFWAGWIAVVVLALVAFVDGRMRFVYRDTGASGLRSAVPAVIGGARLVRTNPTTAAYLDDLAAARALAGGRPIAIVPELPAYWVQARQANPLPVEWPSATELANEQVAERFESALLGLRGRAVVLVATASPLDPAHGLQPITDEDYPFLVTLRGEFRRVGRTRWFEVYE
jgi:hypothetical protein